jgi:predicted PurR-regulated permease PerM
MVFRIALPFIFAVLIAYLIEPWVTHFEKKGLPKSRSILFVYILLSVLLIVFLVLFTPVFFANMSELADSIPEIASIYKSKVDQSLQWIEKSGLPSDIKTMLSNEMVRGVKSLELNSVQYIKGIVLSSMEWLPSLLGLFISVIVSFYLLRDGTLFKNFIFSLSPTQYRQELSLMGLEIHQVLKGFIQGQILVAVIVGLLEAIGLYLVGIRFPFFLGMIGGIANVIPYFGPIIGVIPAILIALTQSAKSTLWTIGVFVIVQQFENAVISPRIMERKLGIHPLGTIFVVILGGELFGIKGMIFALPIFAILKIISKRTLEKIV